MAMCPWNRKLDSSCSEEKCEIWLKQENRCSFRSMAISLDQLTRKLDSILLILSDVSQSFERIRSIS